MLNTIEYVNSESGSLFFYNLNVERQLCIVNQGYAIVTKQQCEGDRTNKFRSTLSLGMTRTTHHKNSHNNDAGHDEDELLGIMSSFVAPKCNIFDILSSTQS